MLKLKDIGLTISSGPSLERNILKGIDLEIGSGEFVTVIGGNGAGKSTLLNIISGEILPTHGEIRIDGQDVTRRSSDYRAQWIARVFQDPLLGTCGELTVLENMALAHGKGRRTLSKSVTSAIRTQCQELLSEVKLGLELRLDTPMEQLSGGQRQAVSLVMSTLSPLKILLLDEHTSALDPKTADRIMLLSDQIVQKHRLTALMITHSLTQALDYGTRTLVLHDGKIRKDLSGPERSALEAQDLLALYQSP